MATRPSARSGSPLSRYNEKRDFDVTREPAGKTVRPRKERTLAADYDVVAALPDSVVAKPLAPVEEVEEREPRAIDAPAASRRAPDLANASRAPLPKSLEPQLATLATAPPTQDRWLVENKFDGYRLTARIERGKVRLVTRGGHDWTAKLKSVAAAVQALRIHSGWLDGEIVVMNEQGLPDFNALQNAVDADAGEQIVYFVFDAPFLGGMDLRRVPLWSRRATLKAALDGAPSERVRYSQEFELPPDYWEARQPLRAAMRTLGFRPAA